MNDTAKDEPLSYIAYCKGGCGGLVFAAVDDPRFAKETAKSVAQAIRDGYTVERATTQAVREANWGCSCPKEKKQKQRLVF